MNIFRRLRKRPLLTLILITLFITSISTTLYLRSVSKRLDLASLNADSNKKKEEEVIPNRVEESFINKEEQIDIDKDEPKQEKTDSTSEEQSQTNPSDTPPAPQPEDPPPTTPEPTPANWWDYPTTINTIPLDQVTHLSTVNKANQLPSTYAPTDLIALTASDGLRVRSGMIVRSIIVDDLRALGAAAKADGVDLIVISSYRSYATQQSTYQYWVAYNGGSTALADQVSARPGHSEHQLGTAVDFSTNEIGDVIGSRFHDTAAAAWLLEHAGEYGFRLSYPAGKEVETGYAHESWHWRWWGE